ALWCPSTRRLASVQRDFWTYDGLLSDPHLGDIVVLASWYSAELTPPRMRQLEGLFQAALREHEFDEVNRILTRNQAKLKNLPAGASAVLFSSPMVSALLESYSLVHLELIADVEFLRSLENRFGAVDVLIRQLLKYENSPLRSAVISR